MEFVEAEVASAGHRSAVLPVGREGCAACGQNESPATVQVMPSLRGELPPILSLPLTPKPQTRSVDYKAGMLYDDLNAGGRAPMVR